MHDNSQRMILLGILLLTLSISLIIGVVIGNLTEPSPKLKDRLFHSELCQRLGGHPNEELEYCNLAGNQIIFPILLDQSLQTRSDYQQVLESYYYCSDARAVDQEVACFKGCQFTTQRTHGLVSEKLLEQQRFDLYDSCVRKCQEYYEVSE